MDEYLRRCLNEATIVPETEAEAIVAISVCRQALKHIRKSGLSTPSLEPAFLDAQALLERRLSEIYRERNAPKVRIAKKTIRKA